MRYRVIVVALIASSAALAGISDGPDPVNRSYGKRGPISGGCNDRQVTACKLWAIDAAAAAHQWLIPTVTCDSGYEITGGPLAGPMTFCGAYVVNPVTGEHVPLPPPPVTISN